MLDSLLHASALVVGSSIYFYLLSVLVAQPRRGWAGRFLLGLIASSGLWYLGNLVAVYLQLGTGREESAPRSAALLLSHIGGWAAWPVGAALAWHALRRKETQFCIALLLCGAVSALASLIFPLGSMPTVIATLPTPIVIMWFLDQRQIFGLYLPRRAVLAAIFGMSTAMYIVLVQPMSALARRWLDASEEVTQVALLFCGAIVFIPLFNLLLEREARLVSRKRERIRTMMNDAERIFDIAERIRFFEERTRSDFGWRKVCIVLEFEADRTGFTHGWRLESEGRTTGWLLVDARPRRRLDVDEPLMETLAQEVGYSLSTLRLLDDKIALERELLEQERLASLGKAAAAIAHEIKNPLSAIKTIAQLMLEDSAIAERYARDLRYIQSETDRLAASVNQLLGFAKPVGSMGQGADLSGLVSTTAEALAKQAAADGITVRSRVEAGWQLPAGNAELISQILLNLSLNAMQASPAGSSVEIVLAGDGPAATELTVTDEGPGIPPELRDRVFEPFFTTRQKGTGLGLAIVRRAVAQVGGEIWFTSPVSDSRGTRFTVRFPGAVQRVKGNLNATGT